MQANTFSRLVRVRALVSLPMALSLSIGLLIGTAGCSSKKKPIDVITSDSGASDTNGDPVAETLPTEDLSVTEVPVSLVTLIKKNTGVEDTIGECVGISLIDTYGIEKASKIAALPVTDTSDDRAVLDQAVLDCRG